MVSGETKMELTGAMFLIKVPDELMRCSGRYHLRIHHTRFNTLRLLLFTVNQYCILCSFLLKELCEVISLHRSQHSIKIINNALLLVSESLHAHIVENGFL